MPTMIVLVNLKEGVSPEDYECWVTDSYAPAAGALPSVSDWRNHRVGGLLAPGAGPPYLYVVTLEVSDLEQLGQNMASEEMQRLYSELHEFAELTQLLADRFF